MVDTCTITRAGADDTTFDPDTGEYADEDDAAVYSGKCLVQISDGLNARLTEAGATDISVIRVSVHVPISAEDIEVDHLVTITAAKNDPDLVGLRFTVIG